MLYPVHWLLSLLASVLRLGAGRGGAEPVTGKALPTLYEFEACPWCRIAREAISETGLSVLVRPCPKGGKRFRPEVQALGGKAQFPYLVDGESGEGMYESAAIAKLMRQEYQTSRPLVHWLGPLNGILSSYAVLLRLAAGGRARASKQQERPLEFYGAEANPAARLVKEQLCALELEYIWHTGEGSAVRLFDPASKADIRGARSARAYLRRTYKV